MIMAACFTTPRPVRAVGACGEASEIGVDAIHPELNGCSTTGTPTASPTKRFQGKQAHKHASTPAPGFRHAGACGKHARAHSGARFPGPPGAPGRHAHAWFASTRTRTRACVCACVCVCARARAPHGVWCCVHRQVTGDWPGEHSKGVGTILWGDDQTMGQH